MKPGYSMAAPSQAAKGRPRRWLDDLPALADLVRTRLARIARSPAKPAATTALPLLEELPGIGDVVWTTVVRLASSPVPTSVLFTAAEKGAGTSVLAAATAVGLAQHRRVPVCLVETNVQRPALAGYLGLESAGLSDVLDGRADLDDCLQQPRSCLDLLVLPAGTARLPVAGELATDELDAILARVKQRCQYLVLDAAPLLGRIESRLLLRKADAVLLVLRARLTRQADAERAHDILVESDVPILGSIFNGHLARDNARVNRAFESAVRSKPARAMTLLRSLREKVAPARGSDVDGPLHANGSADVAPAGAAEADYLVQIDTLERRVVKLTEQLEHTEAELRRIAAMKNVDLGIPSIYRGVQGLSEDEALEAKKALLKEIFHANLELRTAMAAHAL